MTPRIGRPKVNNPQEKRVTVRLNTETVKRLDKWCKENNKSVSDALRMGIEKLLED